MRNFIIDQATGIVKFETAVIYQVSEGEILVETNDLSILIFPEIKIEIPQTISPAEFTYGLALQNITDAEVLDFIDIIEDAEMKLKARILFTKATEFEYNNTLLVVFFPLFSLYVQKPINYDNIFINGILLHQTL